MNRILFNYIYSKVNDFRWLCVKKLHFRIKAYIMRLTWNYTMPFCIIKFYSILFSHWNVASSSQLTRKNLMVKNLKRLRRRIEKEVGKAEAQKYPSQIVMHIRHFKFSLRHEILLLYCLQVILRFTFTLNCYTPKEI